MPFVIAINLALVGLYPVWMILDVLILVSTFAYCCTMKKDCESLCFLTATIVAFHKDLNERYRELRKSQYIHPQ